MQRAGRERVPRLVDSYSHPRMIDSCLENVETRSLAVSVVSFARHLPVNLLANASVRNYASKYERNHYPTPAPSEPITAHYLAITPHYPRGILVSFSRETRLSPRYNGVKFKSRRWRDDKEERHGGGAINGVDHIRPRNSDPHMHTRLAP